MIRIAYFIDSLRIGGTEKQLVEMVQRLDRRCFEPLIVCIRPSDPLFEAGAGAEVLEVPVPRLVSAGALQALFGLARMLRRRRVDVVQTYFIDATLVGVIAAKLARVPRVIASRRDLGFWQNRRTRRALGIVNRWVDRFWVNSRSVGRHVQRLEGIDGERIDVIPNGIDTTLFQRPRPGPAAGGGGPVVGIVANLNRPVKRVDLFIRAAALVAARMPSARFRIVGEGGLRPELESLARDLGLEARLSFLGSRSDVASVAGAFDVGVLCSDSEGFSNSILEYHALGVPVVATDVGGNPEIVENGVDGFLVPPGDHEALARRLETLLADSSLREGMGRRGVEKIARHYAWPARIDEIEEYYQSLFAR